MESGSVLAWLVFLTFNLPVVIALVAVPFASRLSEALQEKSPLGDSTGVTSYSRVIGAVGGFYGRASQESPVGAASGQ